MDSILKKIFDGTIDPMAEVFATDPEYLPLWDEIEAETQALTQLLPTKDAPRLMALQNLLSKVYNMDIYEGFAQGFRLGTGLMWEAANHHL